ncbi:hypothetical protein ABZV91_19000 [Nocardia sp. NPDC004568]|uniref:hypothetical protein n=1 Tax=Nocardia sp. NPDC004568 TaxID=3154551 RepID=UPI0033AB9EBE
MGSVSASLQAAGRAVDIALREAARKSRATYRSTGAELRSAAGRLRDINGRSALKIGALAAATGTGLVVLHGDEKEEYAVPPRRGTAEDAKRINKWWNSLSSAEQEKLLHKEPERIGNLNGIPVAVRSEANKRVRNADIQRVERIADAEGVSAEAVGYSAGAMVVADSAAASRLQADDVVLLGPINADQARSVSDFHLGDRGNVYVGQASDNLNSSGGHLISNVVAGGSNPLDPNFGATRIKAEAPETAQYSSPIGYSDQAHLHYFTAGSESLYSTALIASGNADRLGMRADQIDERPFWPDDDPEADRACETITITRPSSRAPTWSRRGTIPSPRNDRTSRARTRRVRGPCRSSPRRGRAALSSYVPQRGGGRVSRIYRPPPR